MIKNIVLDMGNVLLEYNPRVPLEAFVEKEPDRALIEKELFGGPEWVQRDLGNITIEEMYESVRTRIPVHLHASLRRCITLSANGVPTSGSVWDTPVI